MAVLLLLLFKRLERRSKLDVVQIIRRGDIGEEVVEDGDET